MMMFRSYWKFYVIGMVALLMMEVGGVITHDSAIRTTADATQVSQAAPAMAVPLRRMSNGFKSGGAYVTPAAYRWADRVVTYRITDRSAYYRQIWQRAVQHWNAAGVVSLISAQPGAPAELQMSAVTPIPTGYGQIIGLTYTSYHRNTQIGNRPVLASAHSYLYKRVAKQMAYSQVEREHVAEHEIGHALGLTHAASKRSVMYYANRQSAITLADVAGLKQAYQ
ncbi:matrixin family metalloprotease [Secundilactobacillus paracollinoides]|nr:matrixin family metalloprotease [Secundilactobacillus paracollinoides]